MTRSGVAKRLRMGIGSAVGGLFVDYGAGAHLRPTLAAVCGLLVVGLRFVERSVTPAENGVPAVLIRGTWRQRG